jgi:hypothetical protein
MESENENKQISINGTNNRYQIKKLTKRDLEQKTRKVIENWKITDDTFNQEMQTSLIDTIFLKSDNDSSYNFDLIRSELNKKISSYKQQDISRNLFDETKFVDLKTIIAMLHQCGVECYYCKEKMIVLYEKSREMKQWTVDRINNDLGHNRDNIVLSCLQCNLKRRRTGKDAFLFTRQLNIIKNN